MKLKHHYQINTKTNSKTAKEVLDYSCLIKYVHSNAEWPSTGTTHGTSKTLFGHSNQSSGPKTVIIKPNSLFFLQKEKKTTGTNPLDIALNTDMNNLKSSLDEAVINEERSPKMEKTVDVENAN
ncbi:hypothetical protein HELRODRAFT_174512 [Helobdella robusta]|uniref:Uncharacterized protein n=1 Tax=Helobdella robusta TaxID=6412 RepID=T1F877_HELRO|nr:hypothetical protein HELRODRAFT_174512 [Helobdella robusta]ESO01552.1 hypothetical protein HELRODRAFT_174512 [Helobdella robusta]